MRSDDGPRLRSGPRRVKLPIGGGCGGPAPDVRRRGVDGQAPRLLRSRQPRGPPGRALERVGNGVDAEGCGGLPNLAQLPGDCRRRHDSHDAAPVTNRATRLHAIRMAAGYDSQADTARLWLGPASVGALSRYSGAEPALAQRDNGRGVALWTRVAAREHLQENLVAFPIGCLTDRAVVMRQEYPTVTSEQHRFDAAHWSSVDLPRTSHCCHPLRGRRSN